MSYKIDFGVNKPFRHAYELPQIGYFAMDSDLNPPQWDYCREQFSLRFSEKSKGLFFSHHYCDFCAGTCDDIAQFILKTEEIIDIESYGYKATTFNKTNQECVTWISPSRFWMHCFIKRSLLTILLRASLKYSLKKDNYEEALYSYKYIRDTKLAVMRFLYGFTEFVPPAEWIKKKSSIKTGWQSMFKSATIADVKRLLIHPREDKELFKMGLGCLWA